jgi:hypothetical protein
VFGCATGFGHLRLACLNGGKLRVIKGDEVDTARKWTNSTIPQRGKGNGYARFEHGSMNIVFALEEGNHCVPSPGGRVTRELTADKEPCLILSRHSTKERVAKFVFRNENTIATKLVRSCSMCAMNFDMVSPGRARRLLSSS